MKWPTLIIVFTLCLMTGCASQNGKTYYQLPDSMTNQIVSTTYADHQLWFKNIELSDLLNEPGIVYQINNVEYISASQHLWAGSLSQQLQHTLISNLSRTLPNWLITTARTAANKRVDLMIKVTGFHGRFDGKAVISGSWILDDHQHLIKRSFNLVLPQQQDGYGGLIKALAEGWQDESLVIAQQLKLMAKDKE